MLSPASITLTAGNSRCTVLPDIGGSLGSWTVGDQNMFRAASAQAIATRDPLGLASFPLVPFSNRIGNGKFIWDNEHHMLARNCAAEPHALHGIGWARSWTIEAVSENAATLTLEHSADADWPWAFEAAQEIMLTDTILTIRLKARNLETVSVPLAFGLHPYFEAAGASLSFNADHVWLSGDDGLPATPIVPLGQFDFAKSVPVAGLDVDHCFAGVKGPARIDWVGRPFALEISSLPQMGAAVVYIPQGADTFCFEPVPHINNALNLPSHEPAMPVIAPDGVFETIVCFQAVGKE